MSNFFSEDGPIQPKGPLPLVSTEPNYAFISNEKQLNEYYDDIMRMPYWGLDTETTGLDHHHDKVILLQIGTHHKQFLLDTRYVSPRRLSERLEDENFRKICHNGVFDYKMILGTFNIRTEGIRDTMIAEQLLGCGKQKFGFGLDDVALKYLNVVLDKSAQTSFVGHTGPFTPQQKRYAAIDVVVLGYLMQKMKVFLEQEGLMEVFKIECDAISAFGDIDYYGMNLDVALWKKNIEDEEAEAEKARKVFIETVAPYVGVDLFGKPDINPASSSQVLEVLSKLYPEDMKDRNGKAGTGSEILEKVAIKHGNPPEIMALLHLRGHEVRASTFGHTYINSRCTRTDRLHPRINQIGADTGRPTGKRPNMLNIPQEGRYRVPWVAGRGRKIINNDYGACELRIMASESGDPVMCKGFNEGLDYHTYTASQFIPDPNEFLREFIPDKKGEVGKGKYGELILDGRTGHPIPNPNYGAPVPYDQVTKDQRNAAKSINFGLAYGMGAAKLASNLNISLDLAKQYIAQFNNTFEVLVAWLKKNQEEALSKGYVKTKLGRKRYFNAPQMPPQVRSGHLYRRIYRGHEAVEDPLTGKAKKVPVYTYEALGLPELTYNPLDPWDKNLPENIKKYYQQIASIKRAGGNAPIQGGNADITKIAMYLIRKDIRRIEKERNGGNYLAHIALQIYDEILVDCPEEYAQEIAEIVDRRMREAGARVITRVPVETAAVIADSWVK